MKKFLKWFGIALGGLLIVAFAFFSYLAGSPRDAYFMVRYALPQMHRGHLKIGDAAPDARLLEVNGVSHFYLHQRIGARPLVLIFGSYT